MKKNTKNKLALITMFLSVFIIGKINFVYAGIDCQKQKQDGGMVKFLQDIYGMILIVVPILIVVFSILDFVKAIAASKADDMKKSWTNLIKRLIIGVIVIFLPILITFILELFGQETCMWK